MDVQIDARYDGLQGFAYVGNARVYFHTEIVNNTATTEFNYQWGDLSEQQARAVEKTVRNHQCQVLNKMGYYAR